MKSIENKLSYNATELMDTVTSSVKNRNGDFKAYFDTKIYRGEMRLAQLNNYCTLEHQKFYIKEDFEIYLKGSYEHLEFCFPLSGNVSMDINSKHMNSQGHSDLVSLTRFKECNSLLFVEKGQVVEHLSLNIKCNEETSGKPEFLKEILRSDCSIFKVKGHDEHISNTVNNLRGFDLKGLEYLKVEEASLELMLKAQEIILDKKNYYRCMSKEDYISLEKVVDFIDGNYTQNLNLKWLCQIGRINEFKLKKGFKEIKNLSVFEYIRAKRMEYAEKLLLRGDNSLEEVAILCGYSSYPGFYKAFREKFKFSPSQYQ